MERILLAIYGSEHNVADDAAARVRHAEGKVDGEEVVIGDPAREIVAAADRLDTDCIVMGRRGLGDVGGLRMGSVSHKVGHLTDKTLVTTQ
jgi:nucleotide-binding universal stress UspA family protein